MPKPNKSKGLKMGDTTYFERGEGVKDGETFKEADGSVWSVISCYPDGYNAKFFIKAKMVSPAFTSVNLNRKI